MPDEGRRPLARRAGDLVVGWLVRLLFVVLRALGPDASSALGGAVARAIGPFLGASRVADANLRRFMPELDDAARRRVIREVWDNLGRTGAEFPHLRRLAAGDRMFVWLRRPAAAARRDDGSDLIALDIIDPATGEALEHRHAAVSTGPRGPIHAAPRRVLVAVDAAGRLARGDTLRLAPLRGVHGTGPQEDVGRVLALDVQPR